MEKCPKPRSQVKGRGIATSLPRSSLSRAAPWIGKLHPILLLAASLVVVPWSIQSPLWSRWSHKPYHAASWACEALVVGPPLPTPIRGRRSASLTGTLRRNAEAQSSPSSSSSEASSDSAAFVFLSRDAALNELRAGAQAFRRGEVEDSLLHFDRVYAQCPELRPYLWQRGISLYYANRFDEASHQFHMDVQVNPNDVEEIVWDMAAHARLRPNVYPPPNAMVVADIRRDKRRIMVRTCQFVRVSCFVRFGLGKIFVSTSYSCYARLNRIVP